MKKSSRKWHRKSEQKTELSKDPFGGCRDPRRKRKKRTRTHQHARVPPHKHIFGEEVFIKSTIAENLSQYRAVHPIYIYIHLTSYSSDMVCRLRLFFLAHRRRQRHLGGCVANYAFPSVSHQYYSKVATWASKVRGKRVEKDRISGKQF